MQQANPCPRAAGWQRVKGLLAEAQVSDLPGDVREALDRALLTRRSSFEDGRFIGYYRTHSGNESLLYMVLSDPLDDEGRELLDIFCANVAIAYEGLLERERAH